MLKMEYYGLTGRAPVTCMILCAAGDAHSVHELLAKAKLGPALPEVSRAEARIRVSINRGDLRVMLNEVGATPATEQRWMDCLSALEQVAGIRPNALSTIRSAQGDMTIENAATYLQDLERDPNPCPEGEPRRKYGELLDLAREVVQAAKAEAAGRGV